MTAKQIAFLLALSSALSTTAIELTPDNFDSVTDGKTVFLKFFAPWCGHCKALKPDWDKLIADFEGSENQLIADIDCTSEGEQLCEEHGIQGFPTLKWGDPSDLQDYEGPRDYDSLKQFADENLKPMCSVKNIDLCDSDKKAQIEKYQGMSLDELKGLVDEEETKISDAEEDFMREVEKLQAAYEQLMDTKDKKVAEVKAAGIGLMKSVIKNKETADKKDEL
mmetsp:Transcript_19702/g.40502  ORF Transcript_19702/g.40502 Transcript_19702/m.40502 type:complete len:222 (+) Transcript_19702:143-808(+)